MNVNIICSALLRRHEHTTTKYGQLVLVVPARATSQHDTMTGDTNLTSDQTALLVGFFTFCSKPRENCFFTYLLAYMLVMLAFRVLTYLLMMPLWAVLLTVFFDFG